MPRAKQFNEDEVLNKAITLFWTKGYHATSINDLVQHLGINRASLYDTFGDKEQLFKKALEHYREGNARGFRKFLNSQPDVRSGLKKLFQNAIEASVQDKERKGCFVVNTTTELIPGNQTLLGILEENKKVFEGLFYSYLKEGEARGEFPPGKDLRSIASLLFVLYNGLKVVGKLEAEPIALARAVNAILKLLD